MARSIRCFTVCLKNDEADKVTKLIGYFGGTVGGFCTSVVRDYIGLSASEVVEFRALIKARVEANAKKANGSNHEPAFEGVSR